MLCSRAANPSPPGLCGKAPYRRGRGSKKLCTWSRLSRISITYYLWTSGASWRWVLYPGRHQGGTGLAWV